MMRWGVVVIKAPPQYQFIRIHCVCAGVCVCVQVCLCVWVRLSSGIYTILKEIWCESWCIYTLG